MSVNLDTVAEEVELVVEREVHRILTSGDSLDEKTVRVLESLSKVLTVCYERRNMRPPSDPFEEIDSLDLEKEFE